MKRRILSLFLTCIMLATLSQMTFAAKLEQSTNENQNIYSLWGNFENPASIDMVSFKARPGCVLEQSGDGANGTNYSLKWDSSEAPVIGYDQDLILPCPLVPGETYTVSFYAKTNTPSVTTMRAMVKYNENINSDTISGKTITIGTQWQKIEHTFVCPTTKNGIAISGGRALYLRFGSSQPESCEVLIDELSFVPAGNVAGDYSSVNDGYIPVNTVNKNANDVETIVTSKVEFSDVTNHWAKDVIESLAQYDYINGIGDGLYSPDTEVTRAQFITMVTNLYDGNIPEYDDRFIDVSGDEWFCNAIVKADKLNFLDKMLTVGNKIHPDAAITREEVASIANRVAKKRGAIPKADVNTSFSDESDITLWAKNDVKEAVSYGLIQGYSDGTYKPTANITRAEAAQILFRLVEISSRMHIYVDSENGNDDNDGTEKFPLKTIFKARDMAKKYAPSMENDIKIFMRGKFYLDKTFVLDETNSGFNGYNIVYTSWGKEKPVITMAKEFTDFELYNEDENIYRVYVGVGFNTRQAYFNDVKGIRSRNIGYLENIEYDSENSVFLCDSKELLTYEHINDVECIWNINWTNQRATIKDVVTTDDGKVKIEFYPSFYYVKRRIENRPGAYAQNPVYIENAYELLDEQGEWYMNKYDGYMYYIPRDSDDMDNMVLKVPCGERLIDASGKDYISVLKNVKFDNIKFEGTTWLHPDEAKTYNSEQNGRMTIDGTVQLAGSAVQFDKCKYISITNSEFTQLGMRGLWFKSGAKHIDVIGNEFHDISGGAFMLDDYFLEGYPTRDAKTICEYVRFNNNYVHNTSTDYKCEAAVTFAFPRHSQFNHNEITNIPYTGIHGAYGWQTYAPTGSIIFDVEVNYNYIHDIFNDRVYDGAAIYFVGASSMECEKTNKELNNRCFGNYITHGWSCTYLYPDEGTTSWYYKDNVIDSTGTGNWEYNLFDTPKSGGKFFMHMHSASIKWITVENTYSTLDFAYANGYMNGVECNIEPAHIYPDANWPDEAKEIINNAGIEPEYKGNFNLDGPNYFAAPSRKPRIDDLETPTDIGLTVYDAQGKQYPLSDFETDWWISDPEALSIDENGLFTAHKTAIAQVVGVIKFPNNTTQIHHFRVYCVDKIESITFDVDSINLLSGTTGKYRIYANSLFGEKINVTNSAIVNLKPDDDIVKLGKVDSNGETIYEVEATGLGSTNISGTIEYSGVTLDVNIPIKIIAYSSDEAEGLPFKTHDFGKSWKNPITITDDGGYRVENPTTTQSSPNHNLAMFDNELIAFDMVLKPASTWPSLAICDSDPMGNINNNTCYLIGFKKDYIELQKFNSGVRTMFFGEGGKDYSPVSGPGIPNVEPDKIFEYGKRYSIIVGALDTKQGTRIILTINGENIIDFTDTTSNAIPAKGLFAVYNAKSEDGGFIFYPYTGITNDK